MSALAPIVSFAIAWLLLRQLVSRFADFAPDRPNARSLHERAVPRTGGIALLAGAFISLPFTATPLWLPALLALALAAVSFIDDLRGIPVLARLAAQLAAAGFLVWYVLSPIDLLPMLLLIVGATWITNLYNFMDGSDGLAGGMAAIGFATYAAAGYGADNVPLASLALALAAASAAFLLYNFHPARIFLGDVGSIPLGFLAAVLGIVGWRDDAWPLWFPLLVFAPFIADATATLVKRSVRGERVWRAHREHYYQRAVRMGLGHRGTAYAAYGLMLLSAGTALAARTQAPWVQAAALGCVAAVFVLIAVWVDVAWLRFAQRAENPR